MRSPNTESDDGFGPPWLAQDDRAVFNRVMRALLVAAVMALAVSASACGSDDDSSSTSESSTVASLSVDVPDIVGESVEEATATLAEAGLTLRVLRRDGEDLQGTMDFDESRVNVAVETKDGNEVVTAVISNG
jgi:hypothetical protein